MERALTVPGGDGQAERIRELTGGDGVTAVFDFVGVAPTIALAAASVARQGRVTIVGIAGGVFEWSFYKVPYEVDFTSTYWGTIEELHEVAALYRAGQITPDVEYFAMDDALEAYQKLQDGQIFGRAVVTPNGR